MSNINLIKELRERTNSGLSDCKKALEATNWDVEAAIEWLRENGIAKAAKKAGRIAAEGLIAIVGDEKSAVMIEVNSETDFVAQNEHFTKLLKEVANGLFKSNAKTLEEAEQVVLESGVSVSEACAQATATIGEKISLRRFVKVEAGANQVLGLYLHTNGRIGAITTIQGSNSEVARNVAMHLAAMNPEFVLVENIPADRMEQIKAGFVEPANFASKPANIKEKIVEGWLEKQLSEITLVKQPFVMDDGVSVEKYLSNSQSTLVKAIRYEVGEGIQKVESNFADEVMSVVKGN
ncbi:elongation factor Ts [Mycoplasmopsis anatis]|uniref:Elongation factor Ts n=2 Tax=Mycoplasmopsis anatis TaxID=171279 RepID=F9QE11_9BACT|nr:translation elongation factor Ts [Mycoplasmopsis anatis]AWX70338.1 elongation factor Ts [Mycoplasmopsis anatis]EGS29020.1 elongation factor EF-Ts [Mycoplasmopsis anatis 1340]VEU74016.1 Elongation factor Ts [Mycoplasmopsis anatis]